MKSFFGLLLFAGLIWFIVSLTSSETARQNSLPPVVRHKTQTPQAEFRDPDDGSLIVKNVGTEDWNGVSIYIDSNPPFGYSATLSLKAGEKARYRLVDFTKENGERFNPINFKVKLVWIGGAGYDYEKYAF